MIAALWSSRQLNKIFFLAVALIAVVDAAAYAQVRLNAWNEPCYDALAHKNFSGFVQQLIDRFRRACGSRDEMSTRRGAKGSSFANRRTASPFGEVPTR
jgi:hypothetical protein